MTEPLGKFVQGFDENPSIRENMKTPGINRLSDENSKPANENSFSKPQIRRSSVQGSMQASQPVKYFNGLTDKQKTEAYFDLYDQNLQLRAKQNELESQIKKLSTQLLRLTRDIKPGKLNLEEEIEALSQENKMLKAKLAGKAKVSRPGTFQVKKKPLATQKVDEK